MFCISFFMFDYSYYFFSELAYNCCQAYKINPQLLFSVISSSSFEYCGLFLLLLPQLQVLLKIFLLELVRLLLTVVGACYPHLSLDICSSSWNLAEEKEQLHERFSSGRDFLVTCWVSVLPLLLQDEIAASIITAVNKLSSPFSHLRTFRYSLMRCSI